MNKEQLKAFTGAPNNPVPTGRIDAPIYVSINRKILDVSYGGKEMYGEGSGYALFAGVDASKALARMSFEPQLLNDTDLCDLTDVRTHELGTTVSQATNVQMRCIRANPQG